MLSKAANKTDKKKRGYMVCTGDYVATNTRKQRRKGGVKIGWIVQGLV
jgi:hypothetical protein